MVPRPHRGLSSGQAVPRTSRLIGESSSRSVRARCAGPSPRSSMVSISMAPTVTRLQLGSRPAQRDTRTQRSPTNPFPRVFGPSTVLSCKFDSVRPSTRCSIRGQFPRRFSFRSFYVPQGDSKIPLHRSLLVRPCGPVTFSDISSGMCLCLMSLVQQVHNAAVVARSLGCQCDTEMPTGRTLTET